MNKVLCSACRGKKTMLNVGMMSVKCSKCDGEGSVESVNLPANIRENSEKEDFVFNTEELMDQALSDRLHRIDAEVLTDQIVKKKRGRPPNKD